MKKSTLVMYGACFMILELLMSLGVFVTFPQMTSYAAPKDSLTSIDERLARIELKIDKLMGY